jgi:hypothetical protein
MNGLLFYILNLFFAVGLLLLSFSADSKKNSQKKDINKLVNIILFNSAVYAMMALTLAMCLWGPNQMAKLVGKLSFMLIGWFSVSCCVFIVKFPDEKRNRFVTFMQWVLNLLALYVVFHKNAFNNFVITKEGDFQIPSGLIFSGLLSRKFPLTWYPTYVFTYTIALPLLAVLMLLVRAENTKSLLNRQRIMIVILGVFLSFSLFGFMNYATTYQTMIMSLITIGFLPQVMFFIKADSTNEIWDKKYFLRSSLTFLIRYVLPAVLGGSLFALLWKLNSVNTKLFYLLFVVGLLLIIFACTAISNFANKRAFFRDTRYAAAFEKDITSIEFEDDPADVVNRVEDAFVKHVDSGFIKVFIDVGNGYLEPVFEKDDEKNKVTIPIANEAFDLLLNLKKPIVFRELMKRDYTLERVRGEILSLLNETSSDSFIMLNEGRHIIGVIFLGAKDSGNIYNDYDMEVFTKLYSNFFVIGYYLKNIMNEAVVGTVNREIKMSSQIITSIQENMDHIENPKIDCGYRMVPAHNIGGEFVDLIRLTDTRHLFIIGALSGKGIAASMSMVIMKSITRTFLAETHDFKSLVEKVNLFIRNNLPKGTIFSGTFGLLDFATDTMYYIHCGSPSIFLYTRAYNNVIEIQGEGHILGFSKDLEKYLHVKKVKLSAGDIAMICTDGLIESKSLRGEQFGKNRAQASLLENSRFPADKMAQFTYDSLVHFTSRALDDDITILVFKYLGGNK